MDSRLTILVVVVSFIGLTLGADEPNCKSVVSDLTKRQMTGITVCTKSMKFKNAKDKSQKMTCILKCVLAREGILNAEGYMDKESVDKAMENAVPEPIMREKVAKLFHGCREKHAAVMDPNEEFCKTYDPTIKCLLAGLPALCA